VRPPQVSLEPPAAEDLAPYCLAGTARRLARIGREDAGPGRCPCVGYDVSLALVAEEVWTLRDRDGVLATITITDSDFPWLSGRLDAEPRFQEYRPLFTAELAALESEDWEEFDRMHRAIREQLQLAYPDGRDVPEFLLHVNGDEAWFRWADEPFDSE
jgi:hypothetical protein